MKRGSKRHMRAASRTLFHRSERIHHRPSSSPPTELPPVARCEASRRRRRRRHVKQASTLLCLCCGAGTPPLGRLLACHLLLLYSPLRHLHSARASPTHPPGLASCVTSRLVFSRPDWRAANTARCNLHPGYRPTPHVGLCHVCIPCHAMPCHANSQSSAVFRLLPLSSQSHSPSCTLQTSNPKTYAVKHESNLETGPCLLA